MIKKNFFRYKNNNIMNYKLITFLYFLLTSVFLSTNYKNKNFFLWMGVLGQCILFSLSRYILSLEYVHGTFHLSANLCLYLLFLMSFSHIDIYFYLDDKENYIGIINEKYTYKMFLEFIYVNLSIVSTIGYSDIMPKNTITRTYFSYKLTIVVYMIVFLVSDIMLKKRANKNKIKNHQKK